MQFIRTFFSRLSQLLDVNASSPSNGDVLTYDTPSGKWKNAAASGGAVTSVAGRTGAVTLSAGDVSGLAASATTDATNASNISSGTLANARTTASTSNSNNTLVQRNSNGFIAASGITLPGTTPSSANVIDVVDSEAGTHYFKVTAAGVGTFNGAVTASSYSGSGASLTSLNASNISSGTLGAARLPSPTSSTLGGIQSAAAVSNQWIDSISTSGVPHLSQPSASDISGLAASATTNTTSASNISSGTLSQDRFALQTYAAYATGTAYNLTGSSAQVTHGTTVAVITIAVAGIYEINAGLKLQTAGTQSGFTVSYKLRKTSGTPADLSNTSYTFADDTADAGGAALSNYTIVIPPVFYTATAGDVIAIYASADVTTGLSIGRPTSITAKRIG